MKRSREDILGMVMAGGIGTRLHPLTQERTKPSVPFGGKYRIIDFALSNFINSDIYSIYVLVQYKSQSLIEHIRTTWRQQGVLSKHFITVVPPQMRREKEWYRGTADSIHQNINLIYDFKPQLVAIFGGDHVYRMNIKDMIDYHIRKKSDLTIAVTPIPAKSASEFGVLSVDDKGRVTKFQEKPVLTGDNTVLASMGNYIFNANFLIETLEKSAATDHDFGKDIIPSIIDKKGAVYAYDFSQNRIPNLQKYESQYYWRDVGTILSYWQAHMDLLGHEPKLDLNNQSWPIYASNLNSPPAYISDSHIDNSLICEGSYVCNAVIKNSILGRSVKVEDGCVIEDSIIMDYTHIKKFSSIKRTIVDRFNVINRNTKIGYDLKEDKENFFVSPEGIVVVGRGSRKTFYF